MNIKIGTINRSAWRKIMMTVCVVCIGSLSLFAQQSITVTGVITDETGAGLPGSTVQIKGTPRGVSTDVDGSFTINAKPDDVFEISFVGYETQTVAVENRRKIDVQLKPKANELDEVTIVAFGKQKKSSVVASIETVNTRDLKVPASNLTSAFAGKIPGLISYQTSGEPGADNAQFFVRGVTTFGYAASPLILIDGFESSSDDLARMQPDDIESFSILKDASAAVLYGSRGANGIILVTTKSGQEGSKVKINARVDVNITTPTDMPEMIGAVEYMKLYNQARLSRNPEMGVYYDEQKIQSTMRGENPMAYPNVDWYKMLFNRQTVNTKANLNVSGGGKVATYFVSAGYENETGLLKVDNRNNFNNNININRFNLRNNVIFKLSSTTTLDTRLQARYEKFTGPAVSASDIFKMTMNGNPVDFPAIYEPDAAHQWTDHTLFGSVDIGNSPGVYKPNPYAEMVSGYTTNDESTVVAQATLLQDLAFITEGLKLQAKVSASTWSKYGYTRSYIPYLYGLESYDPITQEYTIDNLRRGTNTLSPAAGSKNTSTKYYVEARANWDRTFSKHSVGAMTVLMLQENLFTPDGSSLFETLPERNVGNSGRLTYDYDDRYFAEFGYGYNGSEKFTGKKQFGFFPSVGAGWLVSNESFWQPVKNVVDLLKLKFTWGLVGNDAISNRAGRFHFLSDMQYGGNYRGFAFGESMSVEYPGYQINRYSNPDIGWEISEKYNLGLELGLLKDSPLKLQVDFFRENRSNIYMERVNFPASAGLETAIYGNVGKMESKGIDGSIDWQKFFNKDFWMTGRVNFTYARNKYTEFDEPEYPDAYRYRKGHPAGQTWGLVAERLFVDDYEVAQSPSQVDLGGTPVAGDIKYTDMNGDGKVDLNDQIAMGYPTTPEIQYGFGLSAGYKNFDLSFFFQGNARVSFFIDPVGIAPFYDRRNALAMVAHGSWTETNPDVHAFWPRLSTERIQNNFGRNESTNPELNWTSSWWLRDGSFVRLKTVEFGYNTDVLAMIGLENLRAYVSAENLFVLSSFKLWDPEMGGNGMGYPLNRRFNVGIQLSF